MSSNNKKCDIGFPCGGSCINRRKKCRNNLAKKGNKLIENFSQYAKRIAEAHSVTGGDEKLEPAKVKTSYEFKDNYDNVKKLGEGSFGTVYLDEGVAVKVGKGSIDENELNIQKKLNEGGFEAAPKVYAEDLANKRVAMEYVGGKSFHQAITDGDLDKSEAKNKALGIVKDLHSRNIAHNDLHTGNLMLDEKGNTKLIDYGESLDKESSRNYEYERGKAKDLLNVIDKLAPEKDEDAFSIVSKYYEKEYDDDLSETIFGGETVEDLISMGWGTMEVSDLFEAQPEIYEELIKLLEED